MAVGQVRLIGDHLGVLARADGGLSSGVKGEQTQDPRGEGLSFDALLCLVRHVICTVLSGQVGDQVLEHNRAFTCAFILFFPFLKVLLTHS